MAASSNLKILEQPDLTEQEQLVTLALRLKKKSLKLALQKLRRLYIIQRAEEREAKGKGGVKISETEMKKMLKEYCDED